MTDSSPTVAIVIPVFNEEPVLPELFARLEALFGGAGGNAWRAVFVNDGSRDRSAELIRAQGARDPRFELVELSRNFGFQSALAAGLAHAGGADAVVTMDADLQDPPELIPGPRGGLARRAPRSCGPCAAPARRPASAGSASTSSTRSSAG